MFKTLGVWIAAAALVNPFVFGLGAHQIHVNPHRVGPFVSAVAPILPTVSIATPTRAPAAQSSPVPMPTRVPAAQSSPAPMPIR